MSAPECPLKLEFIEYVPEGTTLTQWDKYSCFEMRWMKGVHIITGSQPNEERTNLRLYFESDRSIWSATLPGGKDNAGQVSFMNMLIGLNDRGLL
jgi:hypothetical protein